MWEVKWVMSLGDLKMTQALRKRREIRDCYVSTSPPKKRLAPHVNIALALLCLVLSPAASAKPANSQTPSDSCTACHADFSSVLPKGHAAVNGAGLASCLPCHLSRL